LLPIFNEVDNGWRSHGLRDRILLIAVDHSRYGPADERGSQARDNGLELLLGHRLSGCTRDRRRGAHVIDQLQLTLLSHGVRGLQRWMLIQNILYDAPNVIRSY